MDAGSRAQLALYDHDSALLISSQDSVSVCAPFEANAHSGSAQPGTDASSNAHDLADDGTRTTQYKRTN